MILGDATDFDKRVVRIQRDATQQPLLRAANETKRAAVCTNEAAGGLLYNGLVHAFPPLTKYSTR